MPKEIESVDPQVLENLKREVVKTAREMFEHGLVKSTFGVVSVRVPETDCVIITPSGFSKAHLATENLCVVNLESKLIQGKLRPSSETSMHVYIHKWLSEANAVLHTHSPMATAFAVANKEIPCVSTEQGFALGGRVPIVMGYSRPGTQNTEELENIVDALKKTKAVLLRKHGVVVIGYDLKEALDNAIVVEDAATIALFSCIIGGYPSELSTDEIKQLREFRLTRYGQHAKKFGS